MRALLMHNPTSGDGDDPKALICEGLRESGYEPTYFSTDEDEYKKAIETEKTDLIVIVGGDGTISKVLARAPDRSVPIAILAAGTANNIAGSLGIEGAPEVHAKHLSGAPTKPLNVGIATGPWGEKRFLEGIGFGAFAKHLDGKAKGDTREEELADARAMLRDAIVAGRPERFEIDVDGEKIVGDFLFVEVINIGSTGPALLLSSDAEPGDGLLDIVYLPVDDRVAMTRWLEQDELEGPMPLKRTQGRCVSVVTEGGVLRRDDNVWFEPEKAQIIRISLEDEPFQVLVPPPNR
ncbi:diacylglycerol/lipid kinase family protein [Methyloligella halotolerans]|nr:diacylglycerol kinase family protein [Methyloligella halotolerans]